MNTAGGTAEPSSRNAAFILSIAALALLATINILPNGFTYDDRFVVIGNPAVQTIQGWKQFFLLPYWPLHQGGDGYRPLTSLLFAVQWAITHDPWVFHAVSVVLYVACCVAIFWLAGAMVSRWCAWWTAALFAVHPVHVEATAGVVGQSELAAGMAIIVAVGAYIRGRQRGRLSTRRQAAIGFVFLIGCLFKEHALVIPLLLLAAEWAFVRDGAGWKQRLRNHRILVGMLVAVTAAYLVARYLVVPVGLVGFAPYTPFATTNAGAWDRLVTMLGIVPHWARLLFVPARLSSEYGPPQYAIGEWRSAQWAGVVLVASFAGAVVVAARRDRRIAFALLWSAVLLLPVSNIVVPSGVLLAERTLFAPSFGACFLVALLITSLVPRVSAMGGLARTAGLVMAGCLLLFGIVRSIVREADWRDNESLFSAAVAAEPLVYRSHYMLGAWHLESGRWPRARVELSKAMSLFDRDPAVAYNLGIGYFGAGDYARAFEMFEIVNRVMPGALDAETKMALALAAQGKLDEARVAAAKALEGHTQNPAGLRAILRAADLADKVARSQSSPPAR